MRLEKVPRLFREGTQPLILLLFVYRRIEISVNNRHCFNRIMTHLQNFTKHNLGRIKGAKSGKRPREEIPPVAEVAAKLKVISVYCD